MARQPRIEFPGAVYHVMARGNAGKRVFLNQRDYTNFLETLGEACDKTGWRIHAYVLMDNHYHLLLETPEANLVHGMKWLQQTFTQRWNVRHKKRGHLLQGRYKAIPVDVDNPGYFGTVAAYIHLNPARAGLIDFENDQLLEEFPWSSLPYLTRPKRDQPQWYVADRFLGEHGVTDHVRGRAAYLRDINARAREEAEEKAQNRTRSNGSDPWKPLRRGWFVGSEPFREYLLQHVNKTITKHGRRRYHGGARRDHDLAEAKRLLKAGLKKLGLSQKELRAMRKFAPEKQLLAFLLRTRTPVSNDWLSKELAMGHTTNVSNGVRAIREATDRTILKRRNALQRI
ncbi:MAG: transposase [Verrucomicrobiota bacterium]